MIVLISGKVKFNSEDGSLLHCATQETVKLTLTASRLLENLLKAPEGILSREQLLTMVWDEYGLQASNSSLNQYISMLRRALNAFGCEDLIITVPKMGFRLNPDIPIIQQEILTVKEPELEPEKFNIRSFKLTKMYMIMIVVIVLLIIFGVVIVTIGPSINTVHYPQYKEHLQGGCEVIFMKNLTERDQEKAIKYITSILKDNDTTCDSTQKIIFDSNDSFTASSAGRTLFSLCTTGKNNQIIACDNVYYHNWKQP